METIKLKGSAPSFLRQYRIRSEAEKGVLAIIHELEENGFWKML